MNNPVLPSPSNWRDLERMGMDAFPALVEERRLGAVFRAAGGLNYRNSSVSLIDPETSRIDEVLAATTEFSARHGIEPVLRLPRFWPEIEEQLSRKGWRIFRSSAVFEAAVPREAPHDGALYSGVALDSWLTHQREWRDLDPTEWNTLEAIFRLIPDRAERIHYCPRRADEPLASAMLWFDGKYSALMNMIVAPSARGKGVGRRFLSAMFAHALDRGAEVMWLQVHLENEAAMALYKQAGFSKVYDYAYWRKPN